MAIGIDIGTTTTRVAVVERKGSDWKVTGYSRVPTAEILGADAQPGRLGEAIKAAGAKRGNAAVSVSGRDVILKISNYPLVPEWRLKLLIDYEIEELSDRAGGDVLGAHRILQIPGRTGGEYTALLALAKEPYLESRIALIEQAGLKLYAGVPSPVAAGNAQAIAASMPGEVVMVVDIGEETTDVSIVHGGKVIFARNANVGGRVFTDAVAETFGIKERTAIKMKHEEGSLEPAAERGEPRVAKMYRALEGAASDIASLLRSSLKFSAAQLRMTDLDIGKIVLSGGVARLPGLDGYLSSSLRLPVEVFDGRPLAGAALDAASQEAYDDDGPAAATAIGLAATTMASAANLVSLELLPTRLVRKRQFLQHQLFVLLAAGMALLSGLLWYALEANNLEFENRAATTLQAEADDLNMLKTNLEEAVEERKSLIRLRESWATVVEPSRALTEVFAVIRRETPADAYLTSVSVAPRTDHRKNVVVAVKGHIRESTSSVSSIYEEFAEKLRALDGFAFTTKNLKHDTDGSGLSFSFELEYTVSP